MKLELQRFASGKDSTLGALFDVTGERTFLCFTLEDEPRVDKVHGETRIPAGTYPIKLRLAGGFHERYAARFPKIHKGMLHLQNVPGFQFILIHCGNRDEDTQGCLLVGDTANFDSKGDSWISNSTQAYQRVYPLLAGQAHNLTITIRDQA